MLVEFQNWAKLSVIFVTEKINFLIKHDCPSLNIYQQLVRNFKNILHTEHLWNTLAWVELQNEHAGWISKLSKTISPLPQKKLISSLNTTALGWIFYNSLRETLTSIICYKIDRNHLAGSMGSSDPLRPRSLSRPALPSKCSRPQ